MDLELAGLEGMVQGGVDEGESVSMKERVCR